MNCFPLSLRLAPGATPCSHHDTAADDRYRDLRAAARVVRAVRTEVLPQGKPVLAALLFVANRGAKAMAGSARLFRITSSFWRRSKAMVSWTRLAPFSFCRVSSDEMCDSETTPSRRRTSCF